MDPSPGLRCLFTNVVGPGFLAAPTSASPVRPKIEEFTHGHVGGLQERAPLPLLHGPCAFKLGLGFGGIDANRLELPRAGYGVIDPDADPPVWLPARARSFF